MEPNVLLELTHRMLVIVVMLSLPVVATSVIVGLLIGIFQAVTQIQDQSIAYGIKLLAAIAVIAMAASWSGSELLEFARQVFESVPARG